MEILSVLDKKADKIINQFSLRNLSLVLLILNGIKNAVELASQNESSYRLQSHSGTNELVQERQLLRKLEALGLFKHEGEDGLFGISTLKKINLSLIQRCIDRGKRRLAMDELGKHEKVDNSKPKSALPEQQSNTKGITEKQKIKEILKQYKFPKKQKALIKALSDFLPKSTKTLRNEIGTGDLSSLKRDTLTIIKKHGLSDILSIVSYKDGFEYFYRLTFVINLLP